MTDEASKAAKLLGRLGGAKGGKATGKSKVRGDSAYYSKIRSLQPKRAQLMAEAVAVVCPDCGEAQPCHTGSEMWTPEDFIKDSGTRPCCSCDRPLLISSDPKVQFR